MARIAKSKDTANWRKGKDLKVGDLLQNREYVGTYPDGEWVVTYSPIVEYLGTTPYMSVTNHVFLTEDGKRHLCGGGEFAPGKFA